MLRASQRAQGCEGTIKMCLSTVLQSPFHIPTPEPLESSQCTLLTAGPAKENLGGTQTYILGHTLDMRTLMVTLTNPPPFTDTPTQARAHRDTYPPHTNMNIYSGYSCTNTLTDMVAHRNTLRNSIHSYAMMEH